MPHTNQTHTRHTISLADTEAGLLALALRQLTDAEMMFKIVLTNACAAREYPDGTRFQGLDGSLLIVDVPDEAMAEQKAWADEVEAMGKRTHQPHEAA